MKKFKILAEFVKDISGETKDVQTYLFVKDYISKYQLTIDIISKPTKNKLIEVNTTLKFKDKEPREKKSYFEIVYASIIKIDEDIKDKKDLQKIILCDVQKEIQPNLEKTFTNLLNNSGFNEVNINKIDFDKLYNERFN
jgi:preprotein translocase subunit SecB|tara:strand:+ start:229 stop:645 length:417 start_codon:yes stop_codon:yes gene_type:complete